MYCTRRIDWNEAGRDRLASYPIVMTGDRSSEE
jgi:hypothetical protein